MDLRNRYQDRSDDKETQYIPVQETRRRSDQYDTQELSAEEIRRRAQQERSANAGRANSSRRSGSSAGQQYYPKNNNGYSTGGYSQNRPMQNNGYGMPSQNQGYGMPNQNNGYGMPPQNNGYGMPSQNQGYGIPPQNNGYGMPPRNQGYGTPPPNQGYPNQQRPPRREPSGNYSGQRSGNAPRQQRAPSNKRRRSSGRPMWQTVLRFILTLVIAVFLLYSAVALIGIFRTNIVATGSRNRTADAAASSQVDNILVIGTDSRDIETDKGRSDSMILLSINSATKTVYMTSFLRDVYVYINDSYGYGKLNAAYSYGGAELLMDTIESNYRIKIDDYVIVSFAACAAVIDAVGGVEITLSDDEANALNEILISEVNELMGDSRNDDLLESGGTFTLNGKQALSYSRIRYVGNADFERTSRQREVLTIAMKKASRNPLALCSIFMNALPEISTNISGLSLYGYSLKAPFLVLGYDIVQQQIPASNTFYPDTIGGEAVLVTDFTENNSILMSTVFDGT